MGRDGIEPSTSGLKDAPLPLHDSEGHIGPQANSLISEPDDAPDTASVSAPWCRCELVTAPNLHRETSGLSPLICSWSEPIQRNSVH